MKNVLSSNEEAAQVQTKVILDNMRESGKEVKKFMHQIEKQMDDLSGKLVSEMQRTENHIIKRMRKVHIIS